MSRLLDRLREIRVALEDRRDDRQGIEKARARVKATREEVRDERNAIERNAATIAQRIDESDRAREQLDAEDERIKRGEAPTLTEKRRQELEALELPRAREAAHRTRQEELLVDAARCDERLEDLARRRRDLTAELRKVEGRIRRAARKASRLHRRIVKRRKKRSLGGVVAFDGTPIARGLALMLDACRRHGWTGVLTSGDRREGIAEKFGKMSQAALYRCYQLFLSSGSCPCSSCNPANPPGRSSHERRGDGTFGAAGSKLEWYETGLDCTEADQLRAIAQELGFDLRRTYADAREQHHSNLFENPTRRLRELGLI